MIIKKFKSLIFYIVDRKILLISLTYIFVQSLYVAFSWYGFFIVFALIFFLIFKLKTLFLLSFFIILACFGRNYMDFYIEKQIKEFVGNNYLDKKVELKGYVFKESVYKHEYARVVFKINDEVPFLVQANTSRFPRLKVGQVCHITGTLIEPIVSEDFDYKEYLRNQRIYYLINYPVLTCDEDREGFFLKNALMDLKGGIRRVVEKKLSEPQASLFLGILFGEKRVFEEEFEQALRITSITHIIVASGYHVSIILLGINKVLFFVPKRTRTLLTIFFIWIYCILVGLSPSIVRASIMITLTLLAVYYGVVSNINIIFFSTIFIFIFLDPRVIKEIGFLLSVSATGGLIYVTPVLDIYVQKFLDLTIPFLNLKALIYKFFQNYFIPSLACTIVTLPIIAYSFQKITLLGVISNILILPVLEYTLILGFLTLFINLLIPLVSDLFFLAIWAQLRYFELVVSYLGGLDKVSFETNINTLTVLFVYLIMFILILTLSPANGKNHYLNIQENF